MVAKTVDDPIPGWGEMRNEQLLGQWYPKILNDQETAGKVVDVEILRRLDAFSMLAKPGEEGVGALGSDFDLAPAGTFRNRLANIDRPMWPLSILILCSYRLVGGMLARVVDRVDPRALERWQVSEAPRAALE